MVGGHELGPFEGGERARREHQQHLGAGARSEGDLGCGARGRRQLDDVAADLLIQDHLGHLLATRLDVAGAEHGLNSGFYRVA